MIRYFSRTINYLILKTILKSCFPSGYQKHVYFCKVSGLQGQYTSGLTYKIDLHEESDIVKSIQLRVQVDPK